MNALHLPFALFALLGFVAFLPVWMYFQTAYAPDLSTEAAFIAQLVLPATVAIFAASWLDPGG